ncbi:MAG: hypothetical protein DRQ51_06325 [Gammaproteobacteria bacterium]|nr:MAG: hypothetical protein DRQ51_06325 [Gammaproteobacteria bacterium]
MPIYDYRGVDDGTIYEVEHPMAIKISTLGELSPYLKQNINDKNKNQKVIKLMSAPASVGVASSAPPVVSPCGSGGCSGGACPM